MTFRNTAQTIPLDPTIISIPQNKVTTYEIDEEQLHWLREKKLVRRGSPFDIFLCLQLSYGSSVVNIDMQSFCARWGVTEAEVLISVAQLQKKEVAEEQSVKQLEIQFLD